MKSPFPGMNPYLEHPALWPDVHQRLITYASDQLQEILPQRFVVAIGERVLFESARSVYPDLSVIDRQDRPGKPGAEGRADSPVVVLLEPVERRETYLEVRDCHSGERVTVIEVLSPANKSSGEGHDRYLAEQRELLDAGVSLVEIDLLRAGQRTVALPPDRFAGVPYLVVVSRGADPSRREVYPVHLADRLPRVAIPLVPPESDVVFDLGKVLDQVYSRGAYARRIDYGRDPEPPLGPSQASWVRSRVAAHVESS